MTHLRSKHQLVQVIGAAQNAPQNAWLAERTAAYTAHHAAEQAPDAVADEPQVALYDAAAVDNSTGDEAAHTNTVMLLKGGNTVVGPDGVLGA